MEIIEGFKSYSPKHAWGNDGFHHSSFKTLADVEERSFWFRSRNQVIKYLVAKFSKNAKRFLEIGCGTGFVLKGLRQNFHNIELIGSEIHINGLLHARSRMPDVELIQLDATEMPFEFEFDAIGAFDVIEHITEDQLVLVNCYRALKPKGHIYITVPQYMFMWSHLDDKAFHKRRYSKAELISKVRAAGFEVNYCGGFVFALFPLMLLSRLVKPANSNDDGGNELYPGKIINTIFRTLMRLDELLIRAGFQLPWGGSLVLVGHKQDL